MAGELRVGDDIDSPDASDGREFVEHLFNHRPARDGQQGFRLREGQRVEAGGVAGSEDDDFHESLDSTLVLKQAGRNPSRQRLRPFQDFGAALAIQGKFRQIAGFAQVQVANQKLDLRHCRDGDA